MRRGPQNLKRRGYLKTPALESARVRGGAMAHDVLCFQDL